VPAFEGPDRRHSPSGFIRRNAAARFHLPPGAPASLRPAQPARGSGTGQPPQRPNRRGRSPSREWDEVDQSDINEALRKQAGAADAVLLGRVTFEEMRGYWPLQTDDETGVTEYLNSVAKYVVSSTMKDPEWERSTVFSGDLEVDVRDLKGKAGKDIVVTGSITLVHELIRLGLVDEYRLFVYPVVLGRGARLFEDATSVPKLKLVDGRPFRSGVVLTSYCTDG
jgi:dihydrofolate reductase